MHRSPLFSSLLTNTCIVVLTRRRKWEMKTSSMLFLLGGDKACAQSWHEC